MIGSGKKALHKMDAIELIDLFGQEMQMLGEMGERLTLKTIREQQAYCDRIYDVLIKKVKKEAQA